MLRTLMQHEVTTNQALTPLHGRPRAPAAALRHAQAQEATLLLAALCSAASEQRRTRRTHGVLSQPRGGGRPSEREPRGRPCPAHRRASGTKECKSRMLLRNGHPTDAVATAAACCCLIQSSQRCSEACRIRAVWYLLRLSAFRLGDRSWMVRWSSASSIGPSMAGRRSVRWRAERCTARPKKHGSDDCHRASASAPSPHRRARSCQRAAAPGAAAWSPRSRSLRSMTS